MPFGSNSWLSLCDADETHERDVNEMVAMHQSLRDSSDVLFLIEISNSENITRLALNI